jgi:uncharacterized membrane protein
VFLGAFLYSLVSFIALKTGLYSNSGRLVLLGVTVGVVILIVVVLLRWINYLSLLGRLEKTIAMVEKAAEKALKNHYAMPYLGGHALPQPYGPLKAHVPLAHTQCGFICHIDAAALQRQAEKYGLTLYLLKLPGSFSDGEEPVMYVSQACSDEARQALQSCFVIDRSRTFDQDPRFGMIVMSEIASRALSPGINDPGTAVDVLGCAVRLLREAVKVPAAGVPEVLYPSLYVVPLNSTVLMEHFFAPVMRDGAGMAEVMSALLKALRTLESAGDQPVRDCTHRLRQIALKRARNAGMIDEELRLLEAL